MRKVKGYIGTQFTPTGTFTAGKISSYWVDKPQTNGYDANVEFLANDNSGR